MKAILSALVAGLACLVFGYVLGKKNEPFPYERTPPEVLARIPSEMSRSFLSSEAPYYISWKGSAGYFVARSRWKSPQGDITHEWVLYNSPLDGEPLPVRFKDTNK